MGHIYAVTEGHIPHGFERVRRIDSEDGVKTLIETLDRYLETRYDVSNVGYVVGNSEGKYLFVECKDGGGSFDFFSFLNSVVVDKSITLSPVNARMVYSACISRGFYTDESPVAHDPDEGDDVEEGTTFMDDEGKGEEPLFELLYERSNTTFSIPLRGVVIGRSVKQADFKVDKSITEVGRTHCQVYPKGASLYVHDMDSQNGTFVNGVKVHPAKDVELHSGDILTLAAEDFKVL